MVHGMNSSVFLLLISCGGICLAGASSEDPRPNIVVILADDMGFSDIGCYGSEIATPHLDGLAGNGIRFTQFYNTARCCPTRASLLTGLYPHQAGVGHMVSDRGTPAYQGYLNDRCVTIAEVLGAAGYHTLMSGKWHVGENRPHWPTDRGFERYYGLVSGGTNYFRLDPGRKMARDGEPYTPPSEGFYITDAFTENAVGFIEEYGRRREPFFLYVAYTAPHWPLHALPADIAKYRGKYRDGWDPLRARRLKRMIDLGIIDRKWRLSSREGNAPDWSKLSERERDEWDLRMAVYAAQIDRMDQGIGRIVGKLREIGALENTLILFLSDNGGCAELIERGKPDAATGTPDSFRSYRLGWANASNTPFRYYKHWVHEGGISTPLIAHWPRAIKNPGRLCREPGHLIDIMATCVDVAGAKYPERFRGREVTPLEGRSLLPLLQGERREPHEALFWEHEGNRAVRQGKWKLVATFRGPWELYDLEEDRTEVENLAERFPERIKEMAAAYETWATRCGVEPWEDVRRGRADRRQPPNILFCIADDWSWPHAGAYGDKVVRTPTFDRIAREGVLLTRAFCSAPSCTPSRGGILTGQAIHRLEEGGNLWSILPEKFKVYPDLLEAHGYRIGFHGKGWGPGSLGGRTRNPAGPSFRSFEEFLKGVPEGTPFCYWFGSFDPHRPYEKGSGTEAGLKIADVVVPPFLPDTPEVRSDILDYYAEVERFDRQVGEHLRTLQAFGRARNTIVVMTSDNGMPFPRAKANVYDYGVRMPLAVRWPARVKGGVRIDGFVSHLDLAPTFLEAAGLTPLPEMTGRSFLEPLTGKGPWRPDAVFLERERHANVRRGDLGYPMRAIRTRDFLYIWNLRPDRWPAGDPEKWMSVGPFGDVDGSPTKDMVLGRRAEEGISRFFRMAFEKRPAEELYDLENDPGQLENVAGRPEYAERQGELRARLRRWMEETSDPRIREGEDPWDRYPYLGPEAKAKRRGAPGAGRRLGEKAKSGAR